MSLQFIDKTPVAENKILLLVSKEDPSIKWNNNIAESTEIKDTGIVLEITPTKDEFTIQRLFPEGNDNILTYKYNDWKYEDHGRVTNEFESKGTFINHDNLFMNVMVAYKMEGMLGKKYQTYHCDAGIPGNIEALDEMNGFDDYPEGLREIKNDELAEYLTATEGREDEYHFIVVKNLTDGTYSSFLDTLVHLKRDSTDMEITKEEYDLIVSTGIDIEKLSQNYY